MFPRCFLPLVSMVSLVVVAATAPALGQECTGQLANTGRGAPTANACTNPDQCGGAGTCLPNHNPDGTPCDDGDIYTTGDACSFGFCVGTFVLNRCTEPPCWRCLERQE